MCVLSAVLCQQLAHLALQDGAQHQDLLRLAMAGHWGQHQGNCHRDFMRFCGQVAFPHPVPVKVKAIDNKTSLEKEEEAHVFLPHMLFSRLGEFYPAFFAKTMELENLEKFWNAVEKTCDPKLSHHPMTLEKDWKRRNVPLFVHGDGVEFQSRDSLLTFSFGSLGGSLSSLETNLYLASFPKSSEAAEVEF